MKNIVAALCLVLSAVPASAGDRRPTQEQILTCSRAMAQALLDIEDKIRVEAANEPRERAALIQGGVASALSGKRIDFKAQVAVEVAKASAYATVPPTIPGSDKPCW